MQPLPMWARWLLASLVAVAVIAGIVIAVSRAGPESPTTEAGAEAETNRIADIAITEDETPRAAALSPGSTPASALQQAISADVRRRIAAGQLVGPLESVTCRADGTPSAGRAPYRCTVVSSKLAYPFLAVVDEHRQQLTWCKVDQPPVANAGPQIPISARCRA
ncbi:MAG: hypothetical protein ACLQBB_09020 [Solirubrobacteraceae bacterium]